MNKEELLQELSTKISTGEIRREEVAGLFGISQVEQQQESGEDAKKSSHFSMTKMLYVLGAAIVVIGIVIFATQVWNDIGFFGRVSITLGSGFLSAAIGSSLLRKKPEDNIGVIFHFIGGMLIPVGAVVVLSELSINSDWAIATIFSAIFAFYLLLNTAHKQAILTFFAITNGTIATYLILGAVIGDSFKWWEGGGGIYRYLTMVVGASYILLGRSFRDGWNKQLVGPLYFFGSFGFLGVTYLQVFNSVPWQLFYFLIVLGGLFLSAYVRSRSILVMSTLFLIAHVSYITNEYFADSLGWPISLVILGFIFIGLGYASISINKKYIKESAMVKEA